MYVVILVCNCRSVQLEKKNAPEYASSENTIQVHSLQLIGKTCGHMEISYPMGFKGYIRITLGRCKFPLCKNDQN